jgi:hypothetical protein
MKFRVFDADHALAIVDDGDLQHWLNRVEAPPVQIVRAAAQSKDGRFLPLIGRAFRSDEPQTRIAAVLAWLALGGGLAGIEKMADVAAREGWQRELELLSAARFRLAEGSEKTHERFCSGEVPEGIRLLLPSILEHLRQRDPGDLALLADALKSYAERALPWVRKLRQDLWESDLLVISEALAVAAREGELSAADGSILHEVTDGIEALFRLGSGIDSLALENAAEVLGHMPASAVLPILENAGRRRLPKRVEKMLRSVGARLGRA